MAVIAFAGVASSVLAVATQTLLLSFILPVSLAGPASSIPDRLAGWGHRVGVLAAGHRVAVAGAGARSRPHGCDRDVPRAGGAVARRAGAAERSDRAAQDLQATFFATPFPRAA
jgi:hypothetical protein